MIVTRNRFHPLTNPIITTTLLKLTRFNQYKKDPVDFRNKGQIISLLKFILKVKKKSSFNTLAQWYDWEIWLDTAYILPKSLFFVIASAALVRGPCCVNWYPNLRIFVFSSSILAISNSTAVPNCCLWNNQRYRTVLIN